MENIVLRDYQKRAIRAVAASGGKQLLHCVMGSGKTLTAIFVKKMFPKIGKTLVICPASIKYQWEAEIKRVFPDAPVYIINGSYSKESVAEVVLSEFCIVNYDVLSFRGKKSKKMDSTAWADVLSKIGFDYLIVDESQKIANLKSARSIAVGKIASAVPYRVLLTGTAYTTKLSSLQAQLQLVDPFRWGDYSKFEKDYISTHVERIRVRGGRQVWVKQEDAPKPEKLKKLHEDIKGYMTLIGRDEVYSELPDIQQVIIPCNVSAAFNTACKVLTHANMEDHYAVAKLREEYRNLRMSLTKEKLPFAKEWLHDYLEDTDEALVVICYYRDTVEQLYEEFKDVAVKVYGGVSSDDKKKAVDSFVNDKHKRLFILNIDSAAGLDGLNKRTSKILFITTDPRAYQVSQATYRIQRLTSSAHDKYIAYHLVANCSLDKATEAVRKQRELVNDAVIEGKFSEEELETDDVKAVVNEMKKGEEDGK